MDARENNKKNFMKKSSIPLLPNIKNRKIEKIVKYWHFQRLQADVHWYHAFSKNYISFPKIG